MSDAAPWLDFLPDRLRGPLARAASGLPPNVALMQILMECPSAGDAEAALDHSCRLAPQPESARLAAVRDLLRATPGAHAIVREVLAGLDHATPPGDALAYWSEAFDRAARLHPEAGVALYAFGDPERLAAVTAEVVDRLAEWGLVGPDTVALDIGCGIGRFERALAPRLARITGIDLSAGMVAQARERSAGLANVEFRQASGRDLAGFADAAFDLVLVVDAFPYLVDAGEDVAAGMIAEIARVLAPGGRLAILNYSYRGDRPRDAADLAAHAARYGLTITRDSQHDFRLWDADTFLLAKP